MTERQLDEDLAAAYLKPPSQINAAISAAYAAEAARLGAVSPPPIIVPPPSVDTATWPNDWDDFPGVSFTEINGTLHATRMHDYFQYISIVNWDNPEEAVTDDPIYGGYILDVFRLRCREGPRINGGEFILNRGYIEVVGYPADHSDGIQLNQGGDLNIRNVKVLCGNNSTSAFYAFNNSHGIIDINGMYCGWLSGSTSKPLWGIRIEDDGGTEARFRHLRIEKGMSMGGDFLCDINTTVWEDCFYTDGTPIPRPNKYVGS